MLVRVMSNNKQLHGSMYYRALARKPNVKCLTLDQGEVHAAPHQG